jgi:PmbA protein
MDFNTFKTLVISAARKAGIEDYELYYVSEESLDAEMFNAEPQSFTSSLSGGAAFRCIVGGRLGAAYTQALSEEQAESLVRRARDNALTLEKEEKAFFAEGGAVYPDCRSAEMPALSPEALTKAALDASLALKTAHEKITDRCSAEAVTQQLRTCLMNSRGVDLSWNASVDMVYVGAVVADGEDTNDDYEIKTGDPAALDLAAMAKRAADKAAAMLGAGTAPTGAYPVIFSGKAMDSLLSTFASAFSAENARKGLSALKGREGQVIASELVTIIDDPFYPGNPFQRHFDGEGSPTFRKEVVSGGVLQTLLYDLSTAHAAGKQTTGNASRMSYDSPVSIQPFTFVLAPGALTEEELLAKCGDGVWIDFLGGLHAGANPISGDFSLQSGGFMVENGVKTRPVRSFTVSGNFFELLKNITALSDRAELPAAQGLTAFAAPAALVVGLTVSGE